MGFNVSSAYAEYEMNVLIIYKKGTDSYKEVVQNYAQSLCVNTHVNAISTTEVNLENLEKYDLIYPDVSLVDADNKDYVSNILTDYVKKGGGLFLEERLFKIFPKDVLGMAYIGEINLIDQTINFPVIPEKYQNLQKVWKSYSVKSSRSFYDVIRSAYRNFKRHNISESSDSYDFDLTKVNLKIHALPDTAVSLVNSNEFTLLSINEYGNGTVLWTINHIPNRGGTFMTRLDLGYPDPYAKNFHFGYATINYLIRNAYLDYLAKEKYGFSIQKTFGAYGRPSFSWQNHIESRKLWENDELIKWIDILREEHQIPTLALVRGSCVWGARYGTVVLNLNVGDNSDPVFMHNGSDTPYLLSGVRLETADSSYLNVGSNASPFVVDWNEDGKKDLIVGNGDGDVFYYQNVGTNDKPVFLNRDILKVGEKNLNVGSNASPFVVVWNEDGKKDLIVGNGDGDIFFHQNVGTNDKPVFLNRDILKVGEKNLNVGTNASPFVVDWNEDGKKDLIIGNGDGGVFFYQNVGTNDKPVFFNREVIRKSETDHEHLVTVMQNASPFVVDWNEDRKKDLIVGMSELHETYAINSHYLKKYVRRNINYALNHSICIIPHCYIGYNYTSEQELHEMEMHKKAFNDLEIPWTKTTGVNHHAWSVHAIPVWQTIYNEKNFGLVYDFGWRSMANDFEKRRSSSYSFLPYGMPFLLMKHDTEFYPFIMWTPNTVREHRDFSGRSGLFVFPVSFDLPITYYFHPEHAFKYTKTDIFLSHLQCFLKYHKVPKLGLYSGEARKIIDSFNKLRDEKEYNMMSEEQAAKAMLNMYFTNLKVRINGNELTLIPNTEDVPESAEEYRGTLGVKIELHPDFKSNGITTDSFIYYRPTERQIYFGASKETTVNLNEIPIEKFHLVRSNVPFTLNISSDIYEITVKSAGMRQLKIFSPYPLQIKNDDSVFEKKRNYYTLTDFGNSEKRIILSRETI